MPQHRRQHEHRRRAVLDANVADPLTLYAETHQRTEVVTMPRLAEADLHGKRRNEVAVLRLLVQILRHEEAKPPFAALGAAVEQRCASRCLLLLFYRILLRRSEEHGRRYAPRFLAAKEQLLGSF